jgi:hypothetical protein
MMAVTDIGKEQELSSDMPVLHPLEALVIEPNTTTPGSQNFLKVDSIGKLL